MNTTPLVHVLVINWNGLEHLNECFESLLASPYANAKFILLDNASDDESINFVQNSFGHDPRVEIHHCGENLGWSRANNVGMQRAIEAGADYVLLLNNDTRVEPDFLDHLVQQAEADKTIGALSPRILMFNEPQIINSVGLEASIIGAGWDKGIGRVDSLEWNSSEPVLGVCGAAMFIRTEALNSAGLLPDDFEIYLDDLDLSMRLWNAGFTIQLCYRSVVYHKFSATMGEGKRAQHKYFLNTRNRSRIVLRNFPATALPVALLSILLAEIRAVGRAVIDRNLWKLPIHFRAWFDAIRYIPTAIAHRKKHPTGTAAYNLIRRRPWFFPGVLFPNHGWYPPTEIDGKLYCPMARTADLDHKGGELSIRWTNPFAHLRSTDVVVSQSDKTLAVLNEDAEGSLTLDIPSGAIHFKANTLIPAEVSGLLHDSGAWIATSSSTTGAHA